MKKRYITRTIFQNELEIVVVDLTSLKVEKKTEIVPMDVKDIISAEEYLEYPVYIKIVAVEIKSEIVNKYSISESDFMKFGDKVKELV